MSVWYYRILTLLTERPCPALRTLAGVWCYTSPAVLTFLCAHRCNTTAQQPLADDDSDDDDKDNDKKEDDASAIAAVTTLLLMTTMMLKVKTATRSSVSTTLTTYATGKGVRRGGYYKTVKGEPKQGR